MNLATLLDYKYQNVWKAQRGLHGKGKNMTGRSGDDLYLPVPRGTVIRDVATREVLGEAIDPSFRCLSPRRPGRARELPLRHLDSSGPARMGARRRRAGA
jgi:GTP-binding protein